MLLDKALGVTEGPLLLYKEEFRLSGNLSPMHKVHDESEPAAVAGVLPRLQAELRDSIGFPQSHPGPSEVLKPGMDKEEALWLLCAALGNLLKWS